MKENLPEVMLAVLLREDDGQLSARHVPIPKPRDGEVLIKIAAAPINPSDLAQIKTVTEHNERLTFIPGIEGSGRVVAAGKGLIPRLLLGRRVACSSNSHKSGTWAEYMVTPAMRCVPLPEELSDEQGSMLLVNPMTAMAFFEIARREKHKAIVNTAAASSLGRMIDLLGKKERIPVINIVRNEKQKNLLVNRGSQHILDSSDSQFQRKLHALSHTLHATLVLDAIGGSMTRHVMLAAPSGSSILIYGNLSGEHPEIDHKSLVRDNKNVTGFFLANYLKEHGTLATLRNIYRVRQFLMHDIAIPVQETFPLDQARQALEKYLSNMTNGKILLVPRNQGV